MVAIFHSCQCGHLSFRQNHTKIIKKLCYFKYFTFHSPELILYFYGCQLNQKPFWQTIRFSNYIFAFFTISVFKIFFERFQYFSFHFWSALPSECKVNFPALCDHNQNKWICVLVKLLIYIHARSKILLLSMELLRGKMPSQVETRWVKILQSSGNGVPFPLCNNNLKRGNSLTGKLLSREAFHLFKRKREFNE